MRYYVLFLSAVNTDSEEKPHHALWNEGIKLCGDTEYLLTPFSVVLSKLLWSRKPDNQPQTLRLVRSLKELLSKAYKLMHGFFFGDISLAPQCHLLTPHLCPQYLTILYSWGFWINEMVLLCCPEPSLALRTCLIKYLIELEMGHMWLLWNYKRMWREKLERTVKYRE